MRPRTAARLAWSIWGAFIPLVAVGMTLVTLNRSGALVAENAVFALIFLAMGTVGALAASRRPGNPIGWILLGVSAGVGIAFVSSEYSVYALRTRPGSLPGG